MNLPLALRFLLFPILPAAEVFEREEAQVVTTAEPCEVNASYALPCGCADVLGGNHPGHEL